MKETIKTSKNPVVELSGLRYTLLEQDAKCISMGVVDALFYNLITFPSRFSISNILPNTFKVWVFLLKPLHYIAFTLSRFIDNVSIVIMVVRKEKLIEQHWFINAIVCTKALCMGIVFSFHVFNELLHLVLLYYRILTSISQNCVVKSWKMVALLSDKIGLSELKRVYATLNKATPLTRCVVISG